MMRFRPLPRWIGCSTQWSYVINQDFLKFPASREVDRVLYQTTMTMLFLGLISFRPLSRWIGSYTYTIKS